ncbi:MAG: ArgE/DapE family deacylase [Halolamina sp.]|uniref:ArgE/DapE family deacylase n=1 Tax=Halolamina sp. TaxID=1940283 RepID=UPI002FC38F3C
MVTRAEIDAAVEAQREEVIEFLRAFIAIETENPPGRNYREGAAFIGSALEEREYDVAYVEVPEENVAEHYPDRADHERVNVVGRKGSLDGIDAADPATAERAEGPHVHFTGHFDVVPAGEDWSHDPFDATVATEDGEERLFGRGASDMKSGVTASLFAGDALEAAGVEFDGADAVAGSLSQSMTIDEETGGFTGLGYLVDEGHVSQANTDYCVYTECFDGSRVCLGHRGVLKFRVTASGAKAHGCMAQDGVNAATALTGFLTRVEEYRDRLHERTTDKPVTPESSRRADISTTMLDAGYSENVVPDRATATFYRVLVPEESVEDAREEIRELMAATEEAFAGTGLAYEEIMFAEPAIVSADCRTSQVYTEEITRTFGESDFVVSPGSDDQRFVVNDAGIDECIVYGPGPLDQAHVADEYVPVERLVTATKVMATSTAELLGVLEA